MSLQDLSQIISKCPCCKRRLFSDKQLQIIYWICKEHLDYKTIASNRNITDGTLRRYIAEIRAKFDVNLKFFAIQLKDFPAFDFSLLWQNVSDYPAIKERILSYQK